MRLTNHKTLKEIEKDSLKNRKGITDSEQMYIVLKKISLFDRHLKQKKPVYMRIKKTIAPAEPKEIKEETITEVAPNGLENL